MNTARLKKLAQESQAWKDAGCQVSDPYDTYPADLYDAAAREEVVIALCDELEQLRAQVERLTAELEDAKSLIGFLNEHCDAAWDLVDADPEQLERIKKLVVPQQAAYLDAAKTIHKDWMPLPAAPGEAPQPIQPSEDK